MAYWLLKTEPEEYSYADLERLGRDAWNGVRSPAALKHLRSMAPGDRAFIYHTGNEKAVVAVAQVVSAAYPAGPRPALPSGHLGSAPRSDPHANDPRLVVVDVAPLYRLKNPVPLAAIKADPAFADWELVRISRLSVMPVPPKMWNKIHAMSGTAPA